MGKKKKRTALTAVSDLADELRLQRRKVDFDTFDIVLQQLMAMIEESDIDPAPPPETPHQ